MDLPRLIHAYGDPAWLPPGGRAEVWLAAASDTPPSPVAIVRLLLTDTRGRILVVDRPDGEVDIPSRRVGSDTAEQAVRALTLQSSFPCPPPVMLGFVRNVVPIGSSDYAWPVPTAHFVVWSGRVQSPAGGRWLDRSAARGVLRQRHWWPLLDHVPRA